MVIGNQLVFGAKIYLTDTTFTLFTGVSKTNWNIATSIYALTAAMILLHLVKFGELSSSNSESYEAQLCITAGINHHSGQFNCIF